MRSTVDVTEILRMGNHFLRESEPTAQAQAERYAIAHFMESLLCHADAYAGYTHLDSANVNYGAECFEADDDSRRFYHTHLKLRS